MRARLVGATVLAAIAAVLALGGPDSGAAPSKACKPGWKHAVVGGRHECLRAGHACKRALDRSYHPYGFHCHGARFTRVPAADLAVAMSDSADPVHSPLPLSYVVRVTNLGPDAARGVALSVTLPAAPVSLEPAGETCAADGASVRCRFSALAVGAEAAVDVVVSPAQLGDVRAAAVVSAATRDPARGNNTVSEATAVLTGDFVRGRGGRPGFQGGTVVTEVDARGGPRGELAEGTFATGLLDAPFRGRVVCLTVAGNRAAVGGVVEQSESPDVPSGSGVVLLITDNGDPGPGQDRSLNLIQVEDPRSCPLDWPDVPPELLIPLSEGNFAVYDAAG